MKAQKVFILAVIALCYLIAVSSSIVSVTPTEEGLGFDVQSPKTCATEFYQTVCASWNGTCDELTTVSPTTGYVTYTNYVCPTNTLATTVLVSGDYKCFCRPYTPISPVLGGNCSIGDTQFAPDGWQCEQSSLIGDGKYYWFSDKTEGDYCTNSFDCNPPGRCVSGVCYNQLITGDTCYNVTSGVDLRTSCSVKDYCPSIGNQRVCTARLASGATCTDANSCPSYQKCQALNDGSGTSTCQNPRYYWIPAGQKANTSFTDCYSGMWDNAINMTCLNYDEIYAIFLPFNNIACTDTTNCSYGTCGCFPRSGQSTQALCYWPRSTPTVLIQSAAASLQRAKTLYDTGCPTSPSNPTTSSNDYCIVRAGLWVAPSTGLLCAGAFTTSSVSSVMISTLIATVMLFITKLW